MNDNTIRFIVHYKGMINSDILCRAIEKVVSSVDILHSSFVVCKLGAYWKIHDDYSVEDYYKCVDIRENLYNNGNVICDKEDGIQCEDVLDKVAMQYAVEAVSHSGKTQLKCVLIRGKDESAVVLNISHLCVDGSDGKYLLYKVVEAYNLICKNGNADELVIKNENRSPKQVLDKFTKEEYKRLKKKEPSSKVQSGFTYPTTEDGHLNMVRKYISKDILAHVKESVREYNATINDVLITAFYHTYAEIEKLDKSTPISVMSMMDLRKHCIDGDSKGLSNISGRMPTVLKKGISDRMEDTLIEIVAQTSKVKEDPYAGLYGMPLMCTVMEKVPLSLMKKVAKNMYKSMVLGITNMGNISCSKLTLDDLVPDRGMFGGPLKKKPSMQISAISFDGEMALSVVGKYTDEDGKYLEDMLDMVAKKMNEI